MYVADECFLTGSAAEPVGQALCEVEIEIARRSHREHTRQVLRTEPEGGKIPCRRECQVAVEVIKFCTGLDTGDGLQCAVRAVEQAVENCGSGIALDKRGAVTD